MKLHLSQQAGQNMFTAYGEGYVAVNQARYERSLIVLPDVLIADWAPRSLVDLSAADLVPLLPLQPEIVLLGTGPTLRFPPPQLSSALIQARIGFEVMDTHAAARTYNILMGEGRRVAAALLL